MAKSYTDSALAVLVLIFLALACLWLKSKLWLVKSSPGNAPARGDPDASIVVFGESAATSSGMVDS